MRCSPPEMTGAAAGRRGRGWGNLQAQRRRSAALLRRRADAPRQWLAAEPHRRAHALALGDREKRLSVKQPGEGSRRGAYVQPTWHAQHHRRPLLAGVAVGLEAVAPAERDEELAR